jgi:low affinity Fe/Cu permease
MQRQGWYRWFARSVARLSGRPLTFTTALALVLLWLCTGPLFGFSDITFLMVFVIQNTQNHDTEALQIKLDELIRATQGASDTLLDLEEMAEQKLDHLHKHYETLAQLARDQLEDQASSDSDLA